MTTHAFSTLALSLSLAVFGAAAAVAAPADPPPDRDSDTAATAAAAAASDDDDDAAFEPVEPGYRLINLPTTLRLPRFRGSFDLTHRFAGNFRRDGSTFGDQAETLFGIDDGATVGFEYRFAIAKHVELAAFRTAFERTIQLYTKIDAVHQHASTPLSASIVVSVEGANNFKEHYQPAIGVSVSRKLGDVVAVYAVPMWVHNTAEVAGFDDDTVFFGVGGRLRIAANTFIALEVSPRLSGYAPSVPMYGFAYEKAVGGHLFQINVTNSFGTTLAQTARGGLENNLKLGFNLSRKFF